MRSYTLNSNSGSYQTGERAFQKMDNSVALARTLLASESGTLFAVDMSTVDNNVTITLPTVSDAIAGCNYDFCFTVNSDDDADFIITTGLDATDIFGGILTVGANSTVDAFNGISKITVDGSVAQSCEGLKMSFLCDGTNWHLSGHIATVVGTVHLVAAAGA